MTTLDRFRERAERKRLAKDADVKRGEYGNLDVERGKPGYVFSVRQASKKPHGRYDTGKMTTRRYYVVFKLDENLKPVWISGVKPTLGTMRTVEALDWSTKP